MAGDHEELTPTPENMPDLGETQAMEPIKEIPVTHIESAPQSVTLETADDNVVKPDTALVDAAGVYAKDKSPYEPSLTNPPLTSSNPDVGVQLNTADLQREKGVIQDTGVLNRIRNAILGFTEKVDTVPQTTEKAGDTPDKNS